MSLLLKCVTQRSNTHCNYYENEMEHMDVRCRHEESEIFVAKECLGLKNHIYSTSLGVLLKVPEGFVSFSF